jgi:hypothetical protein
LIYFQKTEIENGPGKFTDESDEPIKTKERTL